MPELSIVSSLYLSSAHIDKYVDKTYDVASKLNLSFEVVLVNDGSPDESLEKARDLQNQYENLIIVDLARNFGHHPALLAGIKVAKGEFVFINDCDLEEDPAWLIEFKTVLDAAGYDVVYGQQSRRKGTLFESVSGSVFYKLFNFLSETKIPHNLVTSRLMRRAYVDALLQYPERELFLGGTFVLAGFKQFGIPVKKVSRGSTSYSISKRLNLFLSALTSFSPRPLHYIFVLGSTISFLSLFGILIVFYRAFLGETLVGWASVILSVWLFGGLTLFSVGLVGVYVGKVLIESKQRPLYHIKKIYRTKD